MVTRSIDRNSACPHTGRNAAHRFPWRRNVSINATGTACDRRIIESGGACDIPFGAPLPRGLYNVLVAGRCLSSTREGQSSARVMGTCMAMGQAAGTAAAMSMADEVQPARLRGMLPMPLRERIEAQGGLLP